MTVLSQKNDTCVLIYKRKYNYYHEEYPDGRLFYDLDVQKYIASIGMEFTAIIFIAYIICNIFVMITGAGRMSLLKLHIMAEKICLDAVC